MQGRGFMVSSSVTELVFRFGTDVDTKQLKLDSSHASTPSYKTPEHRHHLFKVWTLTTDLGLASGPLSGSGQRTNTQLLGKPHQQLDEAGGSERDRGGVTSPSNINGRKTH